MLISHWVFSNVNFVTIGYSGKPGDSEVHIYPVNMDDHGDILDKIPQWSEINVDKQTGLASQFVESYKTLIGVVYILITNSTYLFTLR